MKRKRRIHQDKNGRDYIKESYFVGGKMKFRKIYVIDGIPAEEFYEKNATDMDHYINGEYWLIDEEKDIGNYSDESNNQETESSDDDTKDLPF